MILYHSTTENRAKQIFKDNKILCNCKRFFTKEENGDGYSSQGYVYLSNEITFATHFGYCHSNVEKTDIIYLYRIDIPDELIEPDYDEMRHQDPTGCDRERYSSDLQCSLLEFKACRVPFDIDFNKFKVDYLMIDKKGFSDISDLFDNAGHNLDYVISNYNPIQTRFINESSWQSV